MYLQLFKRIKTLRFCIYEGIIFTFGFYVLMTVVQFYFKIPGCDETFWSYRVRPLRQKSLILFVSLFAVGIITDFDILILLIAVMLRLQLAKKQKVGLCLVFETGSM